MNFDYIPSFGPWNFTPHSSKRSQITGSSCPSVENGPGELLQVAYTVSDSILPTESIPNGRRPEAPKFLLVLTQGYLGITHKPRTSSPKTLIFPRRCRSHFTTYILSSNFVAQNVVEIQGVCTTFTLPTTIHNSNNCTAYRVVVITSDSDEYYI